MNKEHNCGWDFFVKCQDHFLKKEHHLQGASAIIKKQKHACYL